MAINIIDSFQLNNPKPLDKKYIAQNATELSALLTNAASFPGLQVYQVDTKTLYVLEQGESGLEAKALFVNGVAQNTAGDSGNATAQQDIKNLQDTLGSASVAGGEGVEAKPATGVIAQVEALESIDSDARLQALEALHSTKDGAFETVADEIAKVVANAPTAFDTLKEIADWIEKGQEEGAEGFDAAARIVALENAVGASEGSVAEQISAAVGAETQAREQAEATINGRIDANDTAIENLETAVGAPASEGEEATGLYKEIADAVTSIEGTMATDKSALQEAIGDVADDLAQEIIDRQNAIDGAIDALGGEATSEDGTFVTVKVTTEKGEVTAVSVEEDDIASADALSKLQAVVGYSELGTEGKDAQTVKARLEAIEGSIGEGGSIEDRISDAEAALDIINSADKTQVGSLAKLENDLTTAINNEEVARKAQIGELGKVGEGEDAADQTVKGYVDAAVSAEQVRATGVESGHNTRISALETAMNDETTGISGRLAIAESEIDALQTAVGDANSGLVKKVADNTTAIGTNTTAIGTVADLTTEAKSDLVVAINEVDAHADAANEGVSSINAKLGEVTMGTTATTITGAIAELKSAVDTNKEGIEGIVGDKADLETTEKGTIVGAINEVVGNVSDNATAISTNATAIETEATNRENADKAIKEKIGVDGEGAYVALTTTATTIAGAINELDSEVSALDSGKADKATTIAGYGITDAKIEAIEESNDKNITLGTVTARVLTNESSLNVEKLSGIISIDNLPKGALERCVVVADDDARFALTTENVQVGDTVKVTASNKMFFVKDDTKLGEEAGYEVYTAGSATSVPWSGVTDKPELSLEGHTHVAADVTDLHAIATSGSYNDLENVPDEFVPANHASNKVTALTGYEKGEAYADKSAIEALAATDSLNQALAKLEKQLALKLNAEDESDQAEYASALGSEGALVNVGSATQPVYFVDGVPVAGPTVLTDVPKDAVFTDTTYSAFKGVASEATEGLVPVPTSAMSEAIKEQKFLREDGSWTVPSYTTLADLLGETGASATELNYMKGVTSAVQTQIDSKQNNIIYGASTDTGVAEKVAAMQDGDLWVEFID